MSKNLILEIGTEELPARFINPAVKLLKNLAEKKLKDALLSFKEVKTAGTLRRLTLFVKELAEKQPDREEEVLGPPKKVGLDEKGNFTKAVIGFAKKLEVPPEELELKETPRGTYFCYKRVVKGKKAEEILPQLLKDLISDLHFPKTMRWGDYEFRFARPIRWIMCLLGEKVIPIEIAGVKSDRISYGHRFLSKKPLEFKKADWEEYERVLEENFVIVSPKKRLQKTREEVIKTGEKVGVAELDEELLSENANLVEYPFPVLGRFSEEFLSLPEALIITALKEHQRYFCLRNSEGKLINYFVAVNNNLARNQKVVREGHERVTRARLEDAKFYFEKDLKEKPEIRLERLKGIVYHVKCGTLWDKTHRLLAFAKKLRKKLFPDINEAVLEKACLHAKEDLASEVIKEFPVLQGIMGSIYADYFGEKEISKAIYEQYLPLPGEEKLPETPEGIILSLVDKLDHLCALFGAGETPSGEKDPYGLRRSAYGIIKILIGKKIFLNLEEIIKIGLELVSDQGFLKNENAFEEVLQFLRKRFEGELLSLKFEKNFVSVILNLTLDPYDLYLRLEALRGLKHSQEFEELVIGFKRVAQILKDSGKDLPPVKEELFREEAEKRLWEKVKLLQPELKKLLSEKKYKEYLGQLLGLKKEIDQFFDDVFVMVEEKELRENRLRLLYEVSKLFDSFGNFRSFI